MSYEPVPVDDPRAHALLAEYFEYRVASFPPSAHGYRTSFPDPALFVPPAGEFLLVLDESGEAVGCGGIRRLADEAAPDAAGPALVRYEVKHVWLRPSTRGTGAGRALLVELERRAAALGADVIVLDTNASLTAANGLYRSSGYASVPAYNDNPNATTWYRKRVG